MDSLLYKPLGEWAVDDVLRLVEHGVEEGQRLEYKRELHLKSKGERREAAKDASGMANASGGLLIYGVAETKLPDGRRIPGSLAPLADGKLEERLQNQLDSVVAPRLNYESRMLAGEGGYFLIVRLFQRAGPLHMVEGLGEHRYYLRTGLRTAPMSQWQVEQAHRDLGAVEDRVLARLGRLPLIPALEVPGLDVSRSELSRVGEYPWASVITLALDAPDPLLPMRPAGRQDYTPEVKHRSLSGGAVRAGNWDVDGLGYLKEDHARGNLKHRLRLYDNGVFECGLRVGRGVGRDDLIASRRLLAEVHDALALFGTIYMEAGYFGRVRVWVRIDNAVGTRLGLGQRAEALLDMGRPPSMDPEVEVDTNVELLANEPLVATRNTLDRLWVSYGWSDCHYFDEAGQLKP